MPLENRKIKKNPFCERFKQTLSKYIPAENKIRKNKNSEDFLLNTKQVFSGWNLENFSGECERQNPWLPVWTCVAKPTCPSYKF